MSVAPVDHTGPWTADDVEALPDAGDHARFGVYEGGVLVVSPGVGQARAIPVADLVLGDFQSRRTAPSPQPEAATSIGGIAYSDAAAGENSRRAV